jgi:glycosyltransferase involved in cell wall biosynthesis
LLSPLWPKPRLAKYAGQWNDYEGEASSCRWQKGLLRSRWWGAPVLVYGEWPDQPSHIVPFFTSVMDEAQMDRARTAELRDWTKRPLEVLFVGRLSEAKNVDIIMRAIAQLQRETESVRLRIVGDGPMRGSLEALARDLGIGDSVMFEGAVPQATVLDFYELAHVLVLASQTEGWPKAISEGMAFGLVCIGSDRGLAPQMLGDGRGLLVEPRDIQALTGAIRSVLRNPNRAEEIAKRAAAWSQQFTLERFRDALREVLESAWKVKLRGRTKAESRKQKAEMPVRTNHR